jgi:hypothetical protein
MTKYIDADLLRKEIEKNKNMIDGLFIEGDDSVYDGEDDAYNRVLRIIDSLQQERQIGEEYTIEIGKHTHILRVGSQSDIDNLIRQEKQEQPEVDLEEEINNFWDSCIKHKNERGDNVIWSNKLEIEVLARHFYRLGLKRKDE